MLKYMSSWFTLALGDGIIASAPLTRIEEEFAARYSGAGIDAAVFLRYATENDLHCEVTTYFTPAAAELARAFGASPCPRPAPDNLQLLVGDPECRARLF